MLGYDLLGRLTSANAPSGTNTYTYRLELQLQPPLRAAAVARKGISTYQTELLEIGDDLLGIGQRRGKSLLLVSRQDGSARKRVQIAGACAAYPVDDGAVRLIGPHHGQAAELDPATGRVLARHRLPYGKHAMHAAGQVFALLGDRKDITFAIEGQEREPGQTVVLAVGASDMPPGGMGWDVLPRVLRHALRPKVRWLPRRTEYMPWMPDKVPRRRLTTDTLAAARAVPTCRSAGSHRRPPDPSDHHRARPHPT